MASLQGHKYIPLRLSRYILLRPIRQAGGRKGCIHSWELRARSERNFSWDEAPHAREVNNAMRLAKHWLQWTLIQLSYNISAIGHYREIALTKSITYWTRQELYLDDWPLVAWPCYLRGSYISYARHINLPSCFGPPFFILSICSSENSGCRGSGSSICAYHCSNANW